MNIEVIDDNDSVKSILQKIASKQDDMNKDSGDSTYEDYNVEDDIQAVDNEYDDEAFEDDITDDSEYHIVRKGRKMMNNLC
ncbi:hypothetical protein GH714_007904 [Hevea brasiliensis]|uniref:Uncharacterized protein n=1 Tax=Hevea brasiliensis TaxID=3981 RepID=A0A6A6M9G4_HEVBR|nr:hypothetical protein GH714_007904 [Hevea brasiliensis]